MAHLVLIFPTKTQSKAFEKALPPDLQACRVIDTGKHEIRVRAQNAGFGIRLAVLYSNTRTPRGMDGLCKHVLASPALQQYMNSPAIILIQPRAVPADLEIVYMRADEPAVLVTLLDGINLEPRALERSMKRRPPRRGHAGSTAAHPEPLVTEATASTAEDNTCIVCLDKHITHLAMPCLHYSYCGPCSRQLSECAICRRPITSFVTPFKK